MSRDELAGRVKELIVRRLKLDIDPKTIDDAAPLFGEGLGLDSIDALELGVALHKKYRLKLEQADQRVREHFRSVRTLAEFIRAQGAAT